MCGGGVACELTLVTTDHAGLIGARYDPSRRECVPSAAAAAVSGLAAAVAEVGLVANR